MSEVKTAKDMISAGELALLLNSKHQPVSRTDALKMISRVRDASKGYSKDGNNEECRISDFEKVYRIPLRMAVDDMWYNFFRRNVSRGWVMSYPSSKIYSRSDADFISVRLPKSLSSLISPEVRQVIKEAWEDRYGHTVSGKRIYYNP